MAVYRGEMIVSGVYRNQIRFWTERLKRDKKKIDEANMLIFDN